ncbi:MAG: hypothetical protein Kow0069_23480 [Promethearchaeota archaeon]
MKALVSQMNAFQQAFSQTAQNLLNQMTQITTALARISSASELIPKLKAQNEENNKFLESLSTQLGALNRRLDRAC